MQTNTDTTWMLLAFVGLAAFVSGSPLGGVSLAWAAGMIFQIPFTLVGAMLRTFPLFAPIFILAFLYFYNVIIKDAVGEGLQMFILAGFIILLLGV
ncbi:hypothetical protein HY994_01060 [Candidatus Micrarchaeota archaeon]|nr:hypothetical protein [Candidatus Micrarchaeota archaeon]